MTHSPSANQYPYRARIAGAALSLLSLTALTSCTADERTVPASCDIPTALGDYFENEQPHYNVNLAVTQPDQIPYDFVAEGIRNHHEGMHPDSPTPDTLVVAHTTDPDFSNHAIAITYIYAREIASRLNVDYVVIADPAIETQDASFGPDNDGEHHVRTGLVQADLDACL